MTSCRSNADDGKFTEAVERGLEHAHQALTLADAALGELAFRRHGLTASLVIIVLVLVALALKIRATSA